jgi:purine-cytosine permease-like protein
MELFYYSLIWRAFWLVLIGFFGLIVVIPFCAERFRESPAKTEFHSVRLANLCVIVGVLIWALALIGALVEHLLDDLL